VLVISACLRISIDIWYSLFAFDIRRIVKLLFAFSLNANIFTFVTSLAVRSKLLYMLVTQCSSANDRCLSMHFWSLLHADGVYVDNVSDRELQDMTSSDRQLWSAILLKRRNIFRQVHMMLIWRCPIMLPLYSSSLISDSVQSKDVIQVPGCLSIIRCVQKKHPHIFCRVLKQIKDVWLPYHNTKVTQ